MTSTQFYPDAAALIAALANEIATLNEFISRSGVELDQHDANKLELAEINLCHAETLAPDNDEHARHYARAGLTNIRGLHAATL